MPTIDIPDDNPRRGQVTANAAQDTFNYAYIVFAAEDLKVFVDGTELTEGTDYTVTGVGAEAGGTFVLDTPCAGGELVTHYAQTSIGRDSQYQPDGRFDAPPLERDFDRLTVILQEQARDIQRTAKLNVEDTSTALELPVASTGKALKWDAGGDLINSTYDPDEQVALAASSAATATTQAGISTTQAGISTTQAGLANTARIATEAVLADFETKYLGAFASDPALDNEGNALITGALYFNSVSDKIKVYDGAAWATLSVSFQQLGTGSVPRTVDEKLQDAIDLSDFNTLRNALATGKRVKVPATVTSISVPSGDVTAVLSGLRQIVPEGELQIDLAAGDYTTNTILNGSPNGQRITVRGASMLSRTISAASSGAGSAGDWPVIFSVNDASGAVVGGFVLVKNIVGTGREEVLEGAWEITDVTGNDITVRVKARKASLPALSVSSGDLLIAQTLIRVNDAIGIDVFGEGNTFQNMVLVGNGTGSGDIAGVRIQAGVAGFARSTAFPFAVVNFKEHGFYALTGSTIFCFDAFTSGNGQVGLYLLDGSTASATRIISTGNGASGLVTSTNSNTAGSQGNYSGNTQRGIFSSGMSMVTAASCIVFENQETGVRVDNQAFANVTSAKIAGNTAQGIRCVWGRVNAISADYTGGNGANEQTELGGVIQQSATAQLSTVPITRAIIDGHYRAQLVIADDAAASVVINATAFRVVTVYLHATTSASIQGSYRARTLSLVATTNIASTGLTFTTGVLSGTTGVNGNFTVSAATDGALYFENRTGTSQTIVIDVMGNLP